MTPSRRQMLSILAQCANVPHMGGDAFGISKRQLLMICLTQDDLLMNLPFEIYDGWDKESEKYVFMKSKLEKFLDTTKERAETLETAGELRR